ncbi:DUF6917 domain-containing protein [Saccharopolyspora karakumensis]|uniref:DUF6917 domain-containing protein n=1 Tax=Saccharopolyspora karakumensis TaxID=2530386 RepID=UPI001A9CD728|nr:hypothetical protein [Saccharopolyspora karakumensis]
MNPEEDGPKRTLTARVVKVLVHQRHERGMSLEPHASRCVRAGDVHELVTTDHVETASGARIDRVAFLGFAEFGQGGVIDRGDLLRIGDRFVGTVLGFDACHFPNHYNILVHTDTPLSGGDLGLRPEAELSFAQTPEAAVVASRVGLSAHRRGF